MITQAPTHRVDNKQDPEVGKRSHSPVRHLDVLILSTSLWANSSQLTKTQCTWDTSVFITTFKNVLILNVFTQLTEVMKKG